MTGIDAPAKVDAIVDRRGGLAALLP